MITEKRGMIFVLGALLFTFISLSISSASVLAAGCILHPSNSDLYCVENSGASQEICADDPNCRTDPRACEIIPDCEYIECGTPEGCQFPILRGLCSEPLTPEQSETRCFPGCCTIPASGSSSEPICEYGPDYYQCQQLAKNYLGPEGVGEFFSSDQTTCLNQCGVELAKATLTIIVKNVLGEPLSANIQLPSLGGSTDSSGTYIFSNLNPGIYEALASSSGYIDQTFSISLAPGSSVERTITLLKPGLPGQVSGTIFYLESGTPLPLANAQVTISSTTSSTHIEVTTSADGSYTQDSLPPGAYSLTASHPDYGSEQTIITISEAEDLTGIDLTLQGKIFQGVKGVVSLNSVPTPGAEIYLDGRYVSISRDSGFYQLPLEADSTTHTIRATYAGYYEAEGSFMITPSLPVVDLDLILQRAEAVCQPGNWLALSTINYEFTPGEPEVTLSWTAPCPEVIGYQLTRISPSGEETSWIFASSVTSFWDYGLEWGETYSYIITSLYAHESRIYTSDEFQIDLLIGDEICRYYEPGETFCEVPSLPDELLGGLPGSSSFPLTSGDSSDSSEDPIFSCGPDNRYTQIDTCEEGSCASDRSGGTTCLQDDACTSGGRPFGLYYELDRCYYGDSLGADGFDTSSSSSSSDLLDSSPDTWPAPSQFCYYDYSEKNTVVDSCDSCSEIENCFGYRSKEACEFNSCLTAKCSWTPAADTSSESSIVDYREIFRALDLREDDAEAVFPETGAGFCVQENYNQDDQCSQCDSKNGNVFENYLCTPDVCTDLGRCFSNPLNYPGRNEPLLSFCAECGDHPTELSTCYTYTTELECVGNSSISSTNGILTLSDDNCNWGRCSWDGSSCIKDGNADEEEDCAESDARCKQDNTAPVTTLLNGPIPSVSLLAPLIEFEGDDTFHPFGNQQNDLSTFGYCLSSVDSPEPCFGFTTLEYTRRTGKEKISFNLIDQLSEELDGKTYKISYYSEDEYFNRESAKSSLLYIDNVIPDFDINQTILINGDRVKVKAWLNNPSELMSCNFTLSRPGAAVSLQSYNTDYNEVKTIDFTEFANIVNAELNVTCIDRLGNRNSKVNSYTFDLEETIDIVYPLLGSSIAETGLIFEVTTTVDARCTLMQNDEVLGDFSWPSDSESRKEHKTNRLTGFTQKEYFNEIKVVCHPFAEIDDFEEYFHFTIDLTPPGTQIILTEGDREYKPTERVWETSFVSSVQAIFECSSEGFPCDRTYYCLGGVNDLLACPPFPNENYRELTSESITINESSRICYYSTDLAGNKVFSANCGTINIVGFGIDFEYPQVYTFQDQQWVISPTPVFDWQFSTRVPAKECRYDFKADFNYYGILDVQTIQPTAQGKYHVSNFPQNVFKSYPSSGGTYDVYIKCLGLTGELSLEQKYIMEYDPHHPDITQAYADPNQIYEEIRTNIFAFTDRKTVCKYSDDSDGEGSNGFETMEYSFPGFVDHILYLEHEDIYTFNSFFSPDGKKDFILNTQCSSGAGLLSDVKEITFKVDYSSVGFISSMIAGSGNTYIYSHDVPLYVETSKKAVCQYLLEGRNNLFTETGGKQHSTTLLGLDEGSYHIPVRCEMEGNHVAEGMISFIIDLTPPVISTVDDGNLTCGSPEVQVMIHSNEANISSYYYEVYSLGKAQLKYPLNGTLPSPFSPPLSGNNSTLRSGNAGNMSTSSSASTSSSTSSLSSSPSTSTHQNTTASSSTKSVSSAPPAERFVVNGTISGSLPIRLNLTELLVIEQRTGNINNLNGQKYFTQVWATDEAGNQGLPKKSDGVIITPAGYAECTIDNAPPKVEFSLNTTCINVLVSLDCQDATGCKELRYGIASSEEECSKNFTIISKNYDGSLLKLERSGWICYSVKDNVGNAMNGTKKISFMDNDGDSIENSCDLCKQTPPGKLAGPEGCSSGEIPGNETMMDQDSDSLPDSWEKIYDAEGCALSYASPDTDGNGLSDAQEDYDQDGASNYEEYLAKTDPCLAEDAPGEWKVQENPWGKGKNLTTGEGLKPPQPPLSPPGSGEQEIIPLILLLLGIILIGSGTGYLIYYYLYSPQYQSIVQRSSARSSLAGGSRGPNQGPLRPGIAKPLLQKEQLLSLRRQKLQKSKLRKRTSLFGEFGSSGSSTSSTSSTSGASGSSSTGSLTDSKSLPKETMTGEEVSGSEKETLEGSKPSLEKEDKGEKEDKETSKETKEKEEPGIFSKLEGLTKKTDLKSLKDLINRPKESKPEDVFGKLKGLAKKKKG